MTRLLVCGVSIVFLTAGIVLGDDDPRLRLAVLDFRVGEGVATSGSSVLAAIARQEFQKNGKYDLMDREMMRERMGEKDFSASAECDEVRCLVRYGKSLDVQKVVGGYAAAFGDKWFLTMRLVDVNTGREEATFSHEHEGKMEDLLQYARDGADVLLGVRKPAEESTSRADSKKKDAPNSSQGNLVLDLGKGVKMDLVLIQAGEFTMGTVATLWWGPEEERPHHKVRITKPFYLGKTEVTQEQWQAVMGENPSHFEGDQLPVERVSWDEAVEFCKKLSTLCGHEVRLPTEAEWEYACRAGSTEKWCFGDNEDQIKEYAWCNKNSDNKTHLVGSRKPNAWGLYDMYGNVNEWCQDRYSMRYYGSSPTDDPAGPTHPSIKNRVLRGGQWGAWPSACRSASRQPLYAGYHGATVGFRIAASKK